MDKAHYFLQPGYIYAPDGPQSISAVIGSGVSVCIFDRGKKTGGMNLYQYPHMAQEGKTTAKYGNVAIMALIGMMKKQGARRKDLEAQIFGGAKYPGSMGRDIGRENIEIAREILKKFKISLTSEDVGGEKGRKVVFNTFTNEIAVLKVDSLRSEDWYPYEAGQ